MSNVRLGGTQISVAARELLEPIYGWFIDRLQHTRSLQGKGAARWPKPVITGTLGISG
jgi:hypothetical protein